jgi:hypothetical protein
MMDWEDVFTAVREATGPGGIYCLGFPRIVKEQFLGNISAARIACAEMQLRRPEIEEVYLQNCVAYRLNHAKPKQKEEEKTMALKEEVVLKDAQEGKDRIIEPVASEPSKELEREYSRLWYRMKVNYPKALSERKKGGTSQDFIDWVKNTYPDLGKPSTRGRKDEKEAPMTPPSPKAPAAPINLPAPPADPPAPAVQTPGSQGMPQGSNGFNFKPVVVSVSGTFTLEQLRIIHSGLSLMQTGGIALCTDKQKQEIAHMKEAIGSMLN